MPIDETVPVVVHGIELPVVERNWAVASHLSALLGWVLPPVGQIAGPLTAWLVKGSMSPFVREHALEALNFQISITIYGGVCGLLATIAALSASSPAPFVAVMVGLGIADTMLLALGARSASQGHAWRYPLTFRFLK